MQEFCKGLKTFTFIFILIVFSSFVTSLEECTGTITTGDVPCHILLNNVNNSESSCNLINVSFFNFSTNIYNQSMSRYSPNACNATFNISQIGTYNFGYTTGDTGSIIVTRGNKMILLMYFLLTVLVAMAIIGFFYQDVVYNTIVGIGLMIFGIYLFTSGFDGITNLLVEFLSIVFIMLGLYFFIPVTQWAMDELNLAN